MTAMEALSAARSAGIEITLCGDDLVLDADQEPTPTVLEALKRNKAEIFALLRSDRDGWLADDWQVFFDERAGIAEFDGGKSRAEAEALAFDCCIAEWLNRHPSRSNPSLCAACGEPDLEGHTVVPIAIEGHGHTWLHPNCWRGWYEARKAEAITALAAMGIAGPSNFPNDFGKNGSA